MNLTKTTWPAGWTPSADPVNGDPGGLLRMDNLQQDETGATTLVRGLQQLSTFSDYVDQIYSKTFAAKECTYIALNTNSNQIIRSADGLFDDQVVIGAGNGQAAFNDALGQVLICAGNVNLKDNGTVTLPLGLQTPMPPIVGAANQPLLCFFPGTAGDPTTFGNPVVTTSGTWQALAGSTLDPSTDATTAVVDVNTTTNIGSAVLKFSTIDTTQIPTFTSENPNNDTIIFLIAPAAPEVISSITIDFICNTRSTDFSKVTDYYSYTFNSPVLTQGEGAQSTLQAQRGQFSRQGTNPALSWTTIVAIRVTVNCLFNTFFNIGSFQIAGGPQGQLNGTYTYLQVNVNNNGTYLAKSPASVPTNPIWVLNGSVAITATAGDPQTTECWIFRTSAVPSTTTGPSSNPLTQESFLDQYYRIGVCAPGATLIDDLSDDEAIEIDIVANLFLNTFVNGDANYINDQILGIAGLFHARVVYMGQSSLYISDELNPDAIDTRFTLKAFGDPTEKNQWIKPVNNNLMILGSTKNLYEIAGTLEILPDGTVDAQLLGIGESYPPLNTSCAVVNGAIYYVAADGFRYTTGSTSIPFSPQLRLLFQNETRIGVPSFLIVPNNFADYSVAAGKTKLYMSVPTSDGGRRLIVWDSITNQFTLRYTNPLVVYATVSDRVLVGYGIEPIGGAFTNGSLYVLDAGPGGVVDSNGNLLSGVPFTFQTVYDSNGQPRNRKDVFTLKLIMDTGGQPVSVMIDRDNQGNWYNLQQQGGAPIVSSGLTTFYFPLQGTNISPNITLGMRYALKIVDTNLVTFFKLYEYTIEYEPRPEQVDYLRLLPTNLNSYARKRFTSFAYVIDTLGNEITFQPYVDNGATGAADVFATATKLTHITYFLTETIGTDIGGIFSGGVFEFYGVNLEETISEKLPTPTEFLIIPPNDYGTPHRKRHTSYKFQIITRGQPVTFTPLLDGQTYSSRDYNTVRKQTVEYFFDIAANDVIGIDIGGTLASATIPPTPFEFYGTVIPEKVEVLPDRLELFRIPNDNFGSAARKRVRTIPMVIDTYGQNVLFTPVVDGVLQVNTTTFNTTGKTTVFHYFINDIFGVDFGGFLQSSTTPPMPFEFYGLGQPENVEVLPVPKMFDQIGPITFDKIGKFFELRTRAIFMGDSVVPIAFYAETDVLPYPTSFEFPSDPTGPIPIFSTNLNVVPYTDQIWSTYLPKSINSSVLRITIGPTQNPFHRYDMKVRVSDSGMQSDSKWVPVR